ncbi:MAG: carboxypeptidase regulatory-like domain-containing protein [Alphaproteobacteria bacterium]|nr:carboxypeptidase regulatory-like domain-containing protein [Alphaproteobacteria bacterium]
MIAWLAVAAAADVPMGTVRVHVQDSEELDVPDARVVVSGASLRRPRTARTDICGRAEVRRVPVGEGYTVEATHPWLDPARAEDIAVEAEGSAVVRLFMAIQDTLLHGRRAAAREERCPPP